MKYHIDFNKKSCFLKLKKPNFIYFLLFSYNCFARCIIKYKVLIDLFSGTVSLES